MAAYRDCPRLRYLTYHYGGKGLQRRTLSLPLINGDFVHLACARLLTGEDVNVVVADLSTKYRDAIERRGAQGETDLDFLIAEQLCLLEGLTRAWARVRLPAILAEFNVISVEQEHEWEMIPGIRVMVRQDAVLERKRDQRWFVKDFKTISASYDTDWGKKFEHDSQVLCYTLAAEEIYQKPIGGLLMEAIIKGKRAADKAVTSPFHGQVIQQSPLCYAYKKAVYGPRSVTAPAYLYERSWSPKAEKVPVWELPGGVEAWIAEWSDLDLNELFITPPVIRPVRRDLERWRRQMAHQEDLVKHLVQHAEAARTIAMADGSDEAWDSFFEALDEYFPQNHNQCFRYFGHPCAMERLCFTEEIEADPIGSGFYQERIPHHSTETSDEER